MLLLTEIYILKKYVQKDNKYLNDISLYSTELMGREYINVRCNVEEIVRRGTIITNQNGEFCRFEYYGNAIKINAKDLPENTEYIELPFMYYKGYSALDEDGNSYNITSGNNFIVRVYTKELKESNTLTVYYAGTKISKLCMNITIFTICAIPIYMFYISYNKRKKK